MAKKKQNTEKTLKRLVLATAIINLIKAVADLVEKLLE